MKNKLFQVTVVFCFSLLHSCIKCKPSEPPPLSVGLRILDKTTNEDLVYGNKYSPDWMEVYYFENNKKNYLKTYTFTDSQYHQAIVYPSNWCTLSESGIQTFYLNVTPMDTDTIGLIVSKTNGKCNSTERLDELRLNGQILENSPIIIRK